MDDGQIEAKLGDQTATYAPAVRSLLAVRDSLVRWLCEDALPLWDHHGVDRASGGYFESLHFTGHTLLPGCAADMRRGRVVTRQMFVFDAGHRLGWRSRFSDPVRHGCEYLYSRMHLEDGLFHSSVDPKPGLSRPTFSLYEYAFYLFALARVKPALSGDFPIENTAVLCLERLRRTWGRPNGGFDESTPPSVPLKSNPHMHLLEAALAWTKVADAPTMHLWVKLAEDMVDLCMTHFVDGPTGAVREYFDECWQPMAGELGRLIEPGHQFEWAWLLLEWSVSKHCKPEGRAACHAAARRLIDLGERWGVDPIRGVAINELWDDMSTKDPSAKLWPQTERMKAWCAMLKDADSVQSAEFACRKIESAARGMMKYFVPERPGLWREILLSDGTFRDEHCKASSFYHVVLAIATLRETLSANLTDVLY